MLPFHSIISVFDDAAAADPFMLPSRIMLCVFVHARFKLLNRLQICSHRQSFFLHTANTSIKSTHTLSPVRLKVGTNTHTRTRVMQRVIIFKLSFIVFNYLHTARSPWRFFGALSRSKWHRTLTAQQFFLHSWIFRFLLFECFLFCCYVPFAPLVGPPLWRIEFAHKTRPCTCSCRVHCIFIALVRLPPRHSRSGKWWCWSICVRLCVESSKKENKCDRRVEEY